MKFEKIFSNPFEYDQRPKESKVNQKKIKEKSKECILANGQI